MNDFIEKLDNKAEAAELSMAAKLMVNDYRFNAGKVVEEIKKDKHRIEMMDRIAMQFIHYWGAEAEEWRTEDRNRVAVERCREIADLSEFPYSNEDEYAKEFVEQMKEMHPTLMQTFSGFIFRFIDEHDAMSWKYISAKMSYDHGDKWYCLPLT